VEQEGGEKFRASSIFKLEVKLIWSHDEYSKALEEKKQNTAWRIGQEEM